MREVVVELSFSDGRAIAVGPITLVFEAGITQITFEVLVGDDTIFELTESVNAALSFPGGIAPPRVSIAQETTQITILDGDSSGQDLVTCYQCDGCSSSGLVFDGVTIQDCCDNINGGGLGGTGFGSSYQQDGFEGCLICPVVLGFIPSEFSGIERGVTYTVMAGFLSGKPPQGGNLNLNLMLGTAGPGDVTASPRVQPRATDPIQPFQITLTVDGISQEFNETFSIEFVGFTLEDPFLFPLGATPTINTLTGTIFDQDGVEFSLSEGDFRENEAPNAMMAIEIAKDGILANPVLFRVTPLTVTDAERLNILKFTRPADDDVSPSVADTNDFNDTAFNVRFPADEIVNIADVEEFIPIEDDEIDEAQEQVFIILLEILEAVNFDLITITRNTSFGRILDNDGIQIGFALPQYSFDEPDFETIVNDIVLVREGGRLSEQTFQVLISVGDPVNIPPAILEFDDEERADYRLVTPSNFVRLNFPPDRQNITLSVILFNDDLPEGTEAFRVTSTPSPNFPNFGPPSMGGAFASTDVLIFDDDLQSVGFQQSSYTVREASGRLEVCVEVFTPQQDDELVSDISLIVESETSTAGNSDFTDVGQHPVLFTALGPRQQCFDVVIINDNLAEGTETFSLILKQDPLLGSTGVVIEPNVAEITILDDSSDTCPGGFLFFELNGVVYEPNSIILISELGTSTTSSSVTDPGSSLVCMTEGVNTECCRNRDGGNIGEWVYPDRSIVPRNSNSRGSDFSRSGFTHQIRLNRLTDDSLGPVGTYMCVVPPQAGCGDEMHFASVQLVLPVPGEVLSLCPITVWGPPRGPFGDYTGYDLRYFVPDGNEMVINKRGNEFFQLVTDEVRSLGPLEDMLVQVRARAGSHVGPYTSAVIVCPMDFVPN